MPILTFTEAEVRAALPKESFTDSRGTPRAWRMFSTMERSGEAASFLNQSLVTLLGNGVPFTDAESLGEALYIAGVGFVRGQFDGECFGLRDSEPEQAFHSLARKLLKGQD